MASQSFQLVMQMGPSPEKVYDLQGNELTIGRDVSNHIVINDPEVSRRHARMIAQAGGYVIEDLGSTNGTFVDGHRLMGPHGLQPGETIMLGEKVSFTYQATGYDPDATLVGVSEAKPAPAPSPLETYRATPPPEEEPPQPSPPPQAPRKTDPYPSPPPYSPPREEQYPEPIPQTEYVPSADYQPAYSGQVPPGPAESYTPFGDTPGEGYDMPADEEQRSRTLIYVGCGCLIVLLCVCVAAFYAFDTANGYCWEPIRTILESIDLPPTNCLQ